MSPTPPRLLLGLSLLLALIFNPCHAESPTPDQPLPEIKANTEEYGVVVNWTLPEGKFRAIEILRNTVRDPRGRTRVASVRAEKTSLVDNVEDLTQTHWYWLKLTTMEGRIINIGPSPSDPTVL